MSAPTASIQAATTDPTIRPFHVQVPDEDLADLRRRIAATRWPSQELVADRSQGVQLATIQELTRYWATDYDWRRCEAKLNALPQFTTEIDGVGIHFIHVKSPHRCDAADITHGWPGSVIELLECGPSPTRPRTANDPRKRSTSCAVPARYGFSAAPAGVGWTPAASRGPGPS